MATPNRLHFEQCRQALAAGKHVVDDVGPGLPMFLPRGAVIAEELEKLAKETEFAAGYQRVRALKPGWRHRIGLHQLFPLLAHVVLFGSGYAQQTHDAARTALAV